MLALVFSEVLQLTPETFGKHDVKFVKFFAPWCGHCKALAPDWVKLSETDTKIVIAEVDCEANNALCGEYGVNGFPTLKLFVGETVYDYEGARAVEPMKTWAEAMLLPALSYSSQSEVDEKSKNQNIYFTVSTEDAAKDEKYFEPFKGKINLYTVKGPRKLTVHRDGEVYELSSFTYSSVDKFITQHKLPFYPELGPDTYAALTAKPLVMFAAEKAKHAKLIKEIGEKVKQLNKEGNAILEKVNFCFIDGERWKQYLENAYKVSDLPSIVGLIKDGDYKTADFEDAEQFMEFATTLLDKKEEL